MVIAICGYMGCGKSSLGRLLADKLSFEFVDSDEYIESTQGKSIPQIFEQSGEQFFRDIEYNAICELVQNNTKNVILSLGGGAVIADKNKELLKNVCVVYIDSPFESCYSRIKNTDRPIVKQKTKEQLEKHYYDRICHYKSVATLTVKGDNLEEMADKITKYIREVLQ